MVVDIIEHNIKSISQHHLCVILQLNAVCREEGGRAAAATSKSTPPGAQFSRPLINAAVHRRRHLTSPFSSPPLHSDTTSRQGVRNVRFHQWLLSLSLSGPHQHLQGEVE